MLNIVIVDDEELARGTLTNLITRQNSIAVGEIHMADSAKTGYELIRNVKPDLVLLDVEMPGGTGFDMLRMFDNIGFKVIFTTAYQHYAIDAIRCSASDYLLKPVDPVELGAALKKVEADLQTRGEEGIERLKLDSLLENVQRKEQKSKLTRLAISSVSGYSILKIKELVFCKADNSYTELHMENGNVVVSTQPLADFDSMLVSSGFFRVNKSYLINGEHISEYQKGNGGTVVMSDGWEISVSRRKKSEFLIFLMEQSQ